MHSTVFNTLTGVCSVTPMKRNDTRNDVEKQERTSSKNDFRTVTLDPKDGWHEVECPYCGEKNGLVETNCSPDGCGKCCHCENTVNLINNIDTQ